MKLLAPLLLLASGSALAVERPQMAPKVPDFAIESKDFNFPSGLRVVMQADHSQPLVAVTMYVDHGSAEDPEGLEGIAHFVEHLWFRSEHGDLPKVMDLINDMGCTFNASTADDFTNYMTVCPSTELEKLIRLEGLRLTHPVRNVTEDVVDIEREVIRNELRMRKENGFMGSLPYIYEHLYKDDHPYARGGIGSHESLTNIKLKDIQEWSDTMYAPEDTTIAIVGDFDVQEASDLLFANLAPEVIHPDLEPGHIQRFAAPDAPEKPDANNPAHWQLWALDPTTAEKNDQGVYKGEPMALGTPPQRISQEGDPPPPAEPKDTKPGHYQAPFEYPTVVVAWSVPGGYRGNTPVMQTAANMANMMIAREAGDIVGVRKDQGAPAVGCFLWESKVDSKLICLAELTDVKYGENVAEKMIDQLPEMWNPELQQFLEPSFSRSRFEGMAGVIQSLDVIAALYGRATQIAQHAHYTGSVTYHSDLMRQLLDVKTQEVAEWAFKYLKRDRAVTVVFEPIPEEDRVLDSSEAAYHGAQRDDDTLNSAYDPKQLTPEVIRDTMVIPPTDKIVDEQLDNGMRVVILDHGEAPVLSADMIFSGGWATDDKGLDDFADTFSENVWDERDNMGFPVMKTDPLTIAGGWNYDGSYNWTSEGVVAPSGNLDGTLWLLRSAMDNRRPDTGYKNAWLKRRFSALKRSWFDEEWWRDMTADQHTNPDHPLTAQATWDMYENMKSWGSGDVQSYLNSKYQPKNATLLIVGNLEALGGAEEAMSQVKTYFADWKPAPNAGDAPGFEMPGPNPPKDTTVYLFDDPKNTQTQVSMRCQVAETTPERQAMTTLAGDLISQQAWTILREKSGVTYGAGAGAGVYNGGTSLLFASSLVQNNSAALAIGVFQDLVNSAQAGDIDEDKLALLKFNRAKKYVLGQQSVYDMSNRLSGVITNGQEWSWFEKYRDGIATATPEAITEAMGTCSDNAVFTIIGPKKMIGPQLEEAGIEYETLDHEAKAEELYEKWDPKGYKKYKKKEAKKEKKKKKEEEEEKDGDEGGDASSGTSEFASR